MRINLVIDDVFLKEIDDYCKALDINRTSFIKLACRDKLNSSKMLDLMPEIKEAIMDLQIKSLK